MLNDYLAFRKRNSVCQYVSNSKLPDIFGKRLFLRVKRLASRVDQFFFKLSPLNESDGQVFLLKMTKGVDGQTTQFLVFAQMRRVPSK